MGRAIMFILFVWLIVGIAAGVSMGSNHFAGTYLTQAIDGDDTTITVKTTQGFSRQGIIVIGNEHIAYSDTTDTTFSGALAQPLIRGAQDTDNVSHSAGAGVRTLQSSMLNDSMSYNIAVITDSSGAMAFVTIPIAAIKLLGTFMVSPLGWLGADFQAPGFILIIIGLVTLIMFAYGMAGGRRV